MLKNTVIESIVKLKPLTLKELNAVPGIGPVKLKSFGDNVVRIVRDCIGASATAETDSTTKPNIKQKKVTTLKPLKLPTPRVSITDEQMSSNDDYFITKRELNHEQQLAASYALGGNNVFITGSAGTGKTFLMKYVIQELAKKHGESAVAVTAPTGIAAIAVGGQTIHSFAGIGLGAWIVIELLPHLFLTYCVRQG